MTDVVSIKFKPCGKVYYFAPNGTEPKEGDRVVVETSNGREMALCAQGVHAVSDDRVVQPLQPVLRVADAQDMQTLENNKKREAEAFQICKKKIAEHGLDMKLVEVECSFEGNKITFFFTSEGRVDFRELVKDLASVFRSRIELRQIGVRDEAKSIGGIGICGRPFCCSEFLSEFYPVSTKMAKVQNLSLNPKKISGCCGRLMCCLRYEQEAYEDLVKTVPKNGAFVQTPDGYGNVTQIDLLRQTVKVRLDGASPVEQKLYTAEQVAAIPGGRPKAGEPLPDILKYVPPIKAAPEKVDDEWADIVLLDEYQDQEKQKARKERLAAAEKAAQEARAKYEGQHRSGRNRRRGGGRGRSNSGGPQKPQGEARPKQEQDKQSDSQTQKKQSRRPQQKKPQQGASQAEKPQTKSVTEGSEKKPNNHHRRRRRPTNGNKPKQAKPEE